MSPIPPADEAGLRDACRGGGGCQHRPRRSWSPVAARLAVAVGPSLAIVPLQRQWRSGSDNRGGTRRGDNSADG